MPENTRLGVWKRSTGFEVIHPYRRGYSFWFSVIVGLLVLLALIVGAYVTVPMETGIPREVFFVVSAAVIVAYSAFLLHKVNETHNTRVRIDITPRSLAITRVSPTGPSVQIATLSLEQVEAIVIDGLRGICVESSAPDEGDSRWFGEGLRVPDLYYLALVLTKAMDGPDRNSTNPNVLLSI